MVSTTWHALAPTLVPLYKLKGGSHSWAECFDTNAPGTARQVKNWEKRVGLFKGTRLEQFYWQVPGELSHEGMTCFEFGVPAQNGPKPLWWATIKELTMSQRVRVARSLASMFVTAQEIFKARRQPYFAFFTMSGEGDIVFYENMNVVPTRYGILSSGSPFSGPEADENPSLHISERARRYMAPENSMEQQFTSYTDYNAATDMFTFGLVLYLLLTGREPRQRLIRNNYRSLIATEDKPTDVDPAVWQLVIQATSTDPADRPTFLWARDVLDQAIRGGPRRRRKGVAAVPELVPWQD